MARNFVQDGHILRLAAPYTRLSGEGAKVGRIFGVALTDIANGVTGDFRVTGVFDLAKVSAQAWTVGQKLYWDDTAKLVTSVNTSNVAIGCAAAAADNPSATGRVRLDGITCADG